MRKKVQDLQPGDRISVRLIVNPNDETDFAHDYAEVVVVEPMAPSYRVHTSVDTLVFETDAEVEVEE